MTSPARALACAFGTWVLATACATTTSHHHMVQQGLTPAPTGHYGYGPKLEGTSFGLGMALASGLIESEAESDREDGALGNVMADKGGRFQVSGSINGVLELGGGLEIRPGSLGSAAASDVDDDAFGSDTIVSPAVAVRAWPYNGEVASFGLTFDLAVVGVPYQRDIGTHVTVERRGEIIHERDTSWSVKGRWWMPVAHVGPIWQIRFGDWGGVVLGGVLSNQPYVVGAVDTVELCRENIYQPDCTGKSPEDVGVVDHALAFSPFIAPAIHLGDHVSVVAQLYANFTTESELTEAHPLGGELAVHLRF